MRAISGLLQRRQLCLPVKRDKDPSGGQKLRLGLLQMNTHRKLQEGSGVLAEQIKYLRIKMGLTQRQLAEKLKIGPSAIGMYEQGRRAPSIDMIIQIANIFEVSVDYLLTGRETPGYKSEDSCHCLCCTCPCKTSNTYTRQTK